MALNWFDFEHATPQGFAPRFIAELKYLLVTSVLGLKPDTCHEVLLRFLPCPALHMPPQACQHLVPQAFPYQSDESLQKLCILLLLAHLLIYSVHQLTWL